MHWDKKARAYDRRLRCSHCQTIRVQLLDSSGHVLRNAYRYPDNYLAKGYDVTGGRDAYRVEAVSRFLASHPDQLPDDDSGVA